MSLQDFYSEAHAAIETSKRLEPIIEKLKENEVRLDPHAYRMVALTGDEIRAIIAALEDYLG